MSNKMARFESEPEIPERAAMRAYNWMMDNIQPGDEVMVSLKSAEPPVGSIIRRNGKVYVREGDVNGPDELYGRWLTPGSMTTSLWSELIIGAKCEVVWAPSHNRL